MEQTITFHITTDDKSKLTEIAKEKGLSVSSYIRSEMLKKIKSEVTNSESF